MISGSFIQIAGTILTTKDITINNGGIVNMSAAFSGHKLKVLAGGTFNFNGTGMSLDNDFENSGNVTFNSGTVNVKGKIITQSGSNFIMQNSNISLKDDLNIMGNFLICSGELRLEKTDETVDKKITLDGGIFNQKGGAVSTEDFEIKNNGSYVMVGSTSSIEITHSVKIDNGTFSQSEGLVTTKDMEIKNGGTYNQFSGEFQIEEDLKVKSGTPINSFNGTGGTVRFTGEGDGEFYGNVQFHNVIVDADAELKISDNNDYIKISGNFTNNSSSLDNEKGTINFNGTTPQTIYSASSPASTNTLVGNLVVSNPTGVTLQTDLGVKTSFTYNSGGYLNIDNKNFYVNGAIYAGALPVELSSFSATTIRFNSKVNLGNSNRS